MDTGAGNAAIRPFVNLVYLHGFASSPGSNKAQEFRRRLAERGVLLHIPDLNVPDFEHLTLTAMLARVAETVRALPPGSVGLIGSSMGGLVALHFADRYRDREGARVEKLLLMAPAFDFMENRQRQLGDEGLARWRESGWLDVSHYGSETTRRVHYGLVEDIQGYDSYAVQVDVPVLIFHGTNDASVDYRQSVRFAESRPNVDLRLLNSDHQLLDQTDIIFEAMVAFFGV